MSGYYKYYSECMMFILFVLWLKYWLNDLRSCYKCRAYESKMASVLNLIAGSLVSYPLNCPLFPYLKEMGFPLSYPLHPYMEVLGSLVCMAKFPRQPIGSPLHCPLFSYLEVVSCPLFPYMEVVDSLICMAKFPRTVHGQPTPLPMCSLRAAKKVVPLFFSVWVINKFEKVAGNEPLSLVKYIVL